MTLVTFTLALNCVVYLGIAGYALVQVMNKNY